MDIKVTKGLASVGNEELRDWTEKGWNQAMREGNYDRSREHLNFEIRPGGIVAPIDKSRPLTMRMVENLASRGIKDPNEGLAEPRFRTVVNFIFGGSTERMRELAFGNQKVDFESKGGNEHIRRMPEIEKWAQDIYRFVADKYGEENIVSFIVHCDEKNPHVHCALLPIDKDKKFAFKKIFHGQNRIDYKNYLLALHDELAKVNEKWGLTRGGVDCRDRSTSPFYGRVSTMACQRVRDARSSDAEHPESPRRFERRTLHRPKEAEILYLYDRESEGRNQPP